MVNEQHSSNNEDELIIDRPQAMNRLRKNTEFSMTVLGWMIWAILCRPLFFAILWFLGFEIFYEHMIRLGGIKALAGFAHIYFAALLVMYLLVRGWNVYNAGKFRNKERRKSVKDVTAEDLERFFKFMPQTIDKARHWKNIVVSLQGQNQLIIQEVRAGSEPYHGFLGAS